MKRKRAKPTIVTRTNADGGMVKFTCSCGASITVQEPSGDFSRQLVADFQEIHTSCKTYQSTAWEHAREATRMMQHAQRTIDGLTAHQTDMAAGINALIARANAEDAKKLKRRKPARRK